MKDTGVRCMTKHFALDSEAKCKETGTRCIMQPFALDSEAKCKETGVRCITNHFLHWILKQNVTKPVFAA